MLYGGYHMGSLYYTDSIGDLIVNSSQRLECSPWGYMFDARYSSAAVGKGRDGGRRIPLRIYWLRFQNVEPGKHMQHSPAV